MNLSDLLRFVFASGVATATLLSLACGDAGKPVPGNADPCLTPVAGVLGCPASSQTHTPLEAAPGFGTVEACYKLVACGVLAAEFLGQSGKECQSNADCPAGECRPDSQGNPRCYFHRLDYFWCIERFNGQRSNRCDSSHRFGDDEVDHILDCIARTPCAALGLPFAEKLKSPPPAMDQFICNDGETNVFTATTCDAGLLSYR